MTSGSNPSRPAGMSDCPGEDGGEREGEREGVRMFGSPSIGVLWLKLISCDFLIPTDLNLE